MKKIIAITAFVFIGSVAYSQSAELVKDARIEILQRKQSVINKTATIKNRAGNYKGYRVMVLNTNNRETYNATRTTLLRYFAQHKLYTSYQSPYFKIKMGDFLERRDAENLRKDLGSLFKHGMFVVQDIIKLTAEDEARLIAEEEKKLQK